MRKGGEHLAATRLIPLHVNKGKGIAKSLCDQTDYARRSSEDCSLCKDNQIKIGC